VGVSFWICAAVTVVSSLVSLGYAIATLRAAQGDVVTPSRYALARSLALAAVAVAALFTGSVGFAAAASAAMAVVQGADAFVGAAIPDRVKTFGPAATSVAGLATLVWMLAAA
jgi:hypothetical protein